VSIFSASREDVQKTGGCGGECCRLKLDGESGVTIENIEGMKKTTAVRRVHRLLRTFRSGWDTAVIKGLHAGSPGSRQDESSYRRSYQQVLNGRRKDIDIGR
jgi:hypothetical protein